MRILVAGIGNIFEGDDAFGVEVAQRLQRRALPEAVQVVDFGIRSFDLAFALLDGYNTTILLDACYRGGRPGSLYVIEPDLEGVVGEQMGNDHLDAHGLNPMRVIRVAHSMGGKLKRILLVRCEPETLGSEEGKLGLSQPVSAAVDEAVGLVESMIIKTLREETEMKEILWQQN